MREERKQNSPLAAALVFLFFLSGAAGLGWQVVWTKSFAAGIGHEFPAMLAVVTAFMSGLAIGNAALIRSERIKPSLYGSLELLIGIWGLLTILLIPYGERIIFNILGIDSSPLWQWFIVFTSILLVLLPATAAMGATMPAAERFLSLSFKRHTTGFTPRILQVPRAARLEPPFG